MFQARAPFTPVLQTQSPVFMAPYKRGAERFGWRFAGSVVFPLGAVPREDGFRLLCGVDDGEIATVDLARDELALRLAKPRPSISGTVHDCSGRPGARLPLKRLLYVPDPIPGIPELAVINFVRALAGRGRTFLDIGSHIGFYTMSLAPGFDQVIAFEPSRFQYGWLTRNCALNDYKHGSAQVGALSTAQLTALKTSEVAALTTAALAGLSTADVAALTTTQVNKLTSAQIASLSTGQVGALSTSQIVALSTTTLPGLTTADVAALTSTQLGALTSTQVSALSTAQVAAFTSTNFG